MSKKSCPFLYGEYNKKLTKASQSFSTSLPKSTQSILSTHLTGMKKTIMYVLPAFMYSRFSICLCRSSLRWQVRISSFSTWVQTNIGQIRYYSGAATGFQQGGGEIVSFPIFEFCFRFLNFCFFINVPVAKETALKLGTEV